MYVGGEQNKPTILKTLVMGQLPEGRRRKGRLEIYSETRFFNGDPRAAVWKVASILSRKDRFPKTAGCDCCSTASRCLTAVRFIQSH